MGVVKVIADHTRHVAFHPMQGPRFKYVECKVFDAVHIVYTFAVAEVDCERGGFEDERPFSRRKVLCGVARIPACGNGGGDLVALVSVNSG